MSSDREVIFRAFDRQDEFARAVWSGQYRYMLYGGAVGGGKTYLVLMLIFALCKIFPGSRWCIVRRDLPTMRRTIIPSFWKLRPKSFIEDINWASMTARCRNGSEILFMPESIAQDRELQRFDGLEVNGFVLEEAAELSEGLYNKVIQRAGRWHVPGLKVQPPLLVLLTCNPSQSWVKRVFYEPWAAGTLEAPYYYLPAYVTDNPYLSEDYRESLKLLPAELYRRFVEGDWSVSDDPLAVIPYDDLRACLVELDDLEAVLADQQGESLGIDVGELGDDPTALVHARGAVLYEVQLYHKMRTDQVKRLIVPRIVDRKIDPRHIGVDAGGVGAGVWGGLHEAGFPVERIMFGGAPRQLANTPTGRAYELQYGDLGTQMWWTLREDIRAREVTILNHPGIVQDLIARRYELKGDRVLRLEPKSDLRRRIGRSPDIGDAAVICNFVRRFCSSPIEYLATPDGESADAAYSDGGSLWENSVFDQIGV